MKYQLIGIYDRGNLQMERLHFKLLADFDLRFCVVIDTLFLNETSITAGQRVCHWFSEKKIKAGENIVLYSRIGTPTTESRTDGSIFHFFFRGNMKSIYDNPKSTIALLEIANWMTPPAPESMKLGASLAAPAPEKSTSAYLKMMSGEK